VPPTTPLPGVDPSGGRPGVGSGGGPPGRARRGPPPRGSIARWGACRPGVRSGSALAAAHVGVEVLLDAALSDDECAQGAYRAALEGAAPSDLGRYVEWASDEQRDRFAAPRTAAGARRDHGRHLPGDRRRAPPLSAGRAPAPLAGRHVRTSGPRLGPHRPPG